jgi:tol-pal system protein YbgF
MHIKPLLILLLSTALTGCALSAPSGDGSRMRNELSRLQQDQQELSRQVAQLQDNVRKLENRLQEQQKFAGNLRSTETAQKVTPSGQKTEASDGIAQAGDRTSSTELYLKAFADYASGRYPEAIKGFVAFVRNYPANDYAGNAQYWLGECYYALENYEQAVRELEKVEKLYPANSKVPDALLKMVPALRKLNRFERAREVTDTLLRRFPDSPAAQKARAGD